MPLVHIAIGYELGQFGIEPSGQKHPLELLLEEEDEEEELDELEDDDELDEDELEDEELEDELEEEMITHIGVLIIGPHCPVPPKQHTTSEPLHSATPGPHTAIPPLQQILFPKPSQ